MSDTERNWTVEGLAHIKDLTGIPERWRKNNHNSEFVVFSDGSTILLVPKSEVNP